MDEINSPRMTEVASAAVTRAFAMLPNQLVEASRISIFAHICGMKSAPASGSGQDWRYARKSSSSRPSLRFCSPVFINLLKIIINSCYSLSVFLAILDEGGVTSFIENRQKQD